MAKAILATYSKVIAPAWTDKITKLSEPNLEFVSRVKEVDHEKLELKQLALEYRHWDRTATKNLI